MSIRLLKVSVILSLAMAIVSLICYCSHTATFVIHGPIAPNFTPASIPSLIYWWVYTDIDTNNVIVTNWPARVGSSTFTMANSTLRPTNTSTGVYFGGTTRLTNNPTATIDLAIGAKGTFWLVFTPETPVSALGAIFADQTGDHGLYTESDNQYGYLAANGGAVNLGSFTSGSTFDLALVYTNVGVNACYTNVVVNWTRATATPYNENQRFMGGDPFGDDFKGKIREFAIFNGALDTNTLGQLHTYATNLYGFTP